LLELVAQRLHAVPSPLTMQESWREMSLRGDGGEDKPLSKAKSKSKGQKAYSGAVLTEKDTGYLDSGFTLNEVGPCAMRVWTAFQAVGLTFHFLLWREVSGHLAEFEAVVDRECAPAHLQHGVCVGPMWNLSARQDLVVPGQSWFNSDMDIVIPDTSWSNSRSFRFTTASSPPTFLVVVDPVAVGKGEALADAPEDLGQQGSELKDASWRLDVKRLRPPQAGSGMTRYHVGPQALSVEDLSREAQQTLAKDGTVEWSATLTSRSQSSSSTRFVVFVEDARTPHLAEIHASEQCAFGRSWKAFNEHRQGHSHRALTWCRSLLGLFLLCGGAAIYAVHSWKGRLRFQLVVLAKFFVQDVPMQICIVLYLIGWYETSGLRCQLCLFQPRHCSDEQAFNVVNVVALSCALLSSISHQLLIRPVHQKVYTEDDICMHRTVRVGGVCIALLPFTTGMCFASRTVLALPAVAHFLLAIPCGLGWFGLVIALCFPVLNCCDVD